MAQSPEPQLTIEVAADPSGSDLSSLTKGLAAANAARAPAENRKRVTLFLRGSDGELVGGLDGHTHWGWLYVKHLWVAGPYQRQGHGRALMAKAEAEAKSRGCRNAHVNTFEFQALAFYERLGYRVFGKLTDYPDGHARYFLEKRGL